MSVGTTCGVLVLKLLSVLSMYLTLDTFQLEPGESRDIFMPIVPTIVQGEIEFTVDAFCFMERDSVTRKVHIKVSCFYYHICSVKFSWADYQQVKKDKVTLIKTVLNKFIWNTLVTFCLNRKLMEEFEFSNFLMASFVFLLLNFLLFFLYLTYFFIRYSVTSIILTCQDHKFEIDRLQD